MADRDTKADEQGYERVCAELMGAAQEVSAAMFGGKNVVVLRELNTKLLESKALRRVWSDLVESRRAEAVFEIGAAAAQEFVEQRLKAHQGRSNPSFLGPYAEYDLAEARRNLEALQRTIELVNENERELENIGPRPLDSDLLTHLNLVQTPPRPLTRLGRFARRPASRTGTTAR